MRLEGLNGQKLIKVNSEKLHFGEKLKKSTQVGFFCWLLPKI